MTTRRAFIGLLGAALATPALPAYTFSPSGRFEMIGQKLVLSKPLIVPPDVEILISRCEFRAAPDFEGDALLQVGNGPRGRIEHCTFYPPMTAFAY